MKHIENLIQELSEKNLLKHPFYTAWSNGELTVTDLQDYSRQYFHHVEAFPRYISATHSNCPDIKARQILLDNLCDEEKGENNHPDLWLRFVEGLGETRENVRAQMLNPETQNLIDTFFRLSRSSYAEGLGALFAYEQQVPEVAKSKIEGLKKYGLDDEKMTEFFRVHISADKWHSKECADLIEKLNDLARKKAERAAHEAADVLWKFLDGVNRERLAA